MTDIINRDELESRLARVIGRSQRAELQKLLALLGNPPRLENVPFEYWENGWKNMAAQVEPVLMDIYLGQVQTLLATIPMGVSWDMVNQGAAEYARRYGYDLVKEIMANTQRGVSDILRGLQTEIPNFYTEGMNIGQLEERLSRWFSPVRAEMIAITETTRAATEAEREVVRDIEKESGMRMIPIWQTNDDELVCEICGPKDGKPIEDGEFPPAHPRCRCWTTHELPKAKS